MNMSKRDKIPKGDLGAFNTLEIALKGSRNKYDLITSAVTQTSMTSPMSACLLVRGSTQKERYEVDNRSYAHF